MPLLLLSRSEPNVLYSHGVALSVVFVHPLSFLLTMSPPHRLQPTCTFLCTSAAAAQRLVEAVSTLHSGHVLFVVVSASPAPTLDVDAVLGGSLPGHVSRRHMLSAAAVGAPLVKPYAVRNTPHIMAGTIVGFFLLFVLSIAISCLAGIDSAPMMMQQPPGPAAGDPQFNGTPREGTRWYPYRNQPFKEH